MQFRRSFVQKNTQSAREGISQWDEFNFEFFWKDMYSKMTFDKIFLKVDENSWKIKKENAFFTIKV